VTPKSPFNRRFVTVLFCLCGKGHEFKIPPEAFA
jgi:hypothetical protein